MREVAPGSSERRRSALVTLDGAEHLEPRVAQLLAGTARSDEQIDGSERPSHDCRLELPAVHPVKLLTTPQRRR